jgi:hypothetical protein
MSVNDSVSRKSLWDVLCTASKWQNLRHVLRVAHSSALPNYGDWQVRLTQPLADLQLLSPCSLFLRACPARCQTPKQWQHAHECGMPRTRTLQDCTGHIHGTQAGDLKYRVAKWHRSVGDTVQEEDLIVDIATDTLYGQGLDARKEASEITMLVECHDDGYLARTFVDTTDSAGERGRSSALPVGVPLAVLCDEEEDVERIRALEGDSRTVLEALGTSVRRDMAWQAYKKTGGGSGCS